MEVDDDEQERHEDIDPLPLDDLLDGSIDSMLPHLPASDAFDSFLMEWMGGDASIAASEAQFLNHIEQLAAVPEEEHSRAEQPSSQPIPMEPASEEPTSVDPSSSGTAEERPSSSPGDRSLETKSAEEARTPGSRYSFRPRSAKLREGLLGRRKSGDEDNDSETASEGSEGTASRHNSGKRLGSRARSLAGRGVAAMSGSVHAVMDAAKGGVSGLAGKLPQKRSRDPEVIKEKEKARNRRAQKAFRERQKALQEERTQSMRSLQVHMGQLAQENAKLQMKLQRLEHSKMDAIATPPAVTDFTCQFDQSEEVSVRLSPDVDNPVELSVDDVKNLTWETLVAIWKEYIDALRALLVELKEDPNGLVHERLNELVKEVAKLTQVHASLNVSSWISFQNSCMTEPTPAPTKAPNNHWQNVLAAVQLSEGQAEMILQFRRATLTKLGAIIKQRAQLLQLQAEVYATLRAEGVSAKDVGIAHLKAVEASRQLLENLASEQSIILQSLCAAQQQIQDPKQKAITIVESWPWYPDTLALASQLARERGEHSTAKLLSVTDVNYRPPSEAARLELESGA